ncbi:MAG: hypothetical protein K2Q03_06030 [Sphingobacteriaceae bacterium]|nr:hypothetical protein [Sphingobacteriaceae bacterium]
MAYNRNSYLKRVRYIVSVYQSVKERDKPDTYIVANIFPKHNIYITYRQWMNIKGTPIPNANNQLKIF